MAERVAKEFWVQDRDNSPGSVGDVNRVRG